MNNKKAYKGQEDYMKQNRKSKFGKKVCIFLMILFTLVMLADIVNLFVTPAQSQISFRPGVGFEMPEGSGMPGGDFQMPEDGEMPGDDFRMPEGGFGGGEAFENEAGQPTFDGLPGGRGGRQGGILQSLRSAWLPILIVCILGDVICVIILLRICSKEQAETESSDEGPGMPQLEVPEEDPEEPPKRKRGPWAGILCLVVAFALILGMIPTEATDTSSANVQSQVISGTAEADQIHAVLSGAGTLEADTLTPVTAPQQVTVLKYHVRNGETVSAGDPLVSVDKTSASSAMMELSDVLADLDDDLEAARKESPSSCLYAASAGRVKKIYAKAGDTVTDVLYEHGALMLLSLDGTMKVVFESSAELAVGETVVVKYSGTSEEGRIASNREGEVTVTLSDEKAPRGEDAVVLSESGKIIGEGKIEISSALKVISYYGKVDSIPVSVGSMVSVGTRLITLTDTGNTTDYLILLARRNELEDQMQQLSQLVRTGMIYAESDGIVSGVPDDAEIELLSSGTAPGASQQSGTGGGWQLMLLSNFGDNSGDNPMNGWFSDGGFFPGGGGPGSEGPGEEDSGNEVPDGGNTGEEDPDSGDTEGEAPAILSGNYAASLYSASNGMLYIWLCPTAVAGNSFTLDLTTLQTTMTQFGGYAYSGIDNASFPLIEDESTAMATLADLKEGDLLLLTFTENVVTGILMAQRTAGVSGGPATDPSQGDGDQAPGGNAGGMPSNSRGISGMPSGSGMTVQKSYDQYILDENELLYVSDQQEITVTISVDELDILSLERGLEAQVTLDAMKGQSFTGRIVRISSEGTNEGGNTKFTVTVALPREATMLDGMNASVKVVTGTSNADVSIPAAALVEEDGKTYVYTSYDQETDVLGGLTEVETGASDGELVEILYGLETGNSFFYRYAGTVTYSFLTSI